MSAVTYVTGDRKQKMMAVDDTTVIDKGNMVRLVTDDVRVLSGLSDSGTKAQNQAAARDVFMGIAMRAHANGGGAVNIPVATAGVFEFNTASATYEIGDLVGPAGTGAAGAVGVSDDTVEAVANGSLAIGRVSKRVPVADTRVQVEIFTTQFKSPTDDTGSFDSISEVTSGAGVTIDSVLLKDAGATLTGNLLVGGTDVATIKGIYLSGTIAVAVPSIANDAAENVDSVAVDVSAMTFAPAVGDAVISIPLEALPTDCLQLGSIVTATDQVTISYGSKEGGGGVTGANKNYKFLFIDLT